MALAALLLCGAMALHANAALSSEYPEPEYADAEISAEELERFSARLQTAQRSAENTFEIIDATAAGSEHVSTDYTAASLNAWNGIVTVNSADAAVLDDFLAQQGLQNATDAQKIAAAVAWIHNNLVYDGYHTGSYAVSCFVEKGGQCNIYNGALAVLLNHLGYKVQLVRGYRGSTGSETAHWWVELLTSGEPLVLETGNREDGTWHYLGCTYAETHGGDRDYIKCDRYAFSGEEYQYYGAAAYRWGVEWLSGTDAALTGRVYKGAAYSVTETGLLFGTSADELSPIAFDAVDENTNAANDSRGFSVSYTLSQCGAALQSGETYWYAFYVDVNGVRCQSAPASLTVPSAASAADPAADPAANNAAQQTADAWTLPAWLPLAAAAAAGALLLAATGIFAARRFRQNRPEKTAAGHISHL